MVDVEWTVFWISHFAVVTASSAMKLIMLDIPSPAALGESVELTCIYELQGDQLYSVKWYKDDIEFYRFVPSDWPPGQFLPLPGVRVDLSRSGTRSVYLRHVDLHTAGSYRCEVSAEAPSFQTAELEREMQVFVLPTEGPKIAGSQQFYSPGDTVAVNCTSTKSKPAAKLRWYINDDLVANYRNESSFEKGLRSSDWFHADNSYDSVYSTTMNVDGLETSTLTLRFIVEDGHFVNGRLKLKCTATISTLYTMSNEELIFREQLEISGPQISENLSRGAENSASAEMIPLRWIAYLGCLLAVSVLLRSHK